MYLGHCGKAKSGGKEVDPGPHRQTVEKRGGVERGRLLQKRGGGSLTQPF